MSLARIALPPSLLGTVIVAAHFLVVGCGGASVIESSTSDAGARATEDDRDASVTITPIADSGALPDGASTQDASPSSAFDTCTAECRAAHGTGGTELILYSCASSCSATCGAQNRFGNDEACTLCVVGKGTDTCTQERAQCRSNEACATAFDCFLHCL